MDDNKGGLLSNIENLLKQDYRGVNIAVYAFATAGLAMSIHKIRPVSKFSKAGKVPDHFLKKHVPLRGVYAGIQHSPVRLLVDHKAPIYLPLWHSSKPPLPVKLWGVEVASGNAVNWLECVAKGKELTLKPIARDNDDLVSSVLLHIPQPETKSVEVIDVGQRLVELGFARATLPAATEKNTIQSRLAPLLLSAEIRAKSYRNGIWSDQLPPLPKYVVIWRKGSELAKDLLIFSVKKLFQLFIMSLKGTYTGIKYVIQRSYRSNPNSPKQVQST